MDKGDLLGHKDLQVGSLVVVTIIIIIITSLRSVHALDQSSGHTRIETSKH